MKIDLSEFYEKPTQRCVVGRFIYELPDPDRKTVLAAIEMPDITASSIHRACERRGAQFRVNSTRLHRRGECVCARI